MNILPTSEKILEKHLETMLGRERESYITIEEMKKLPEWTTTINAMVEFARLHVEECKSLIIEESNKHDMWDEDIRNCYPSENIE